MPERQNASFPWKRLFVLNGVHALYCAVGTVLSQRTVRYQKRVPTSTLWEPRPKAVLGHQGLPTCLRVVKEHKDSTSASAAKLRLSTKDATWNSALKQCLASDSLILSSALKASATNVARRLNVVQRPRFSNGLHCRGSVRTQT